MNSCLNRKLLLNPPQGSDPVERVTSVLTHFDLDQDYAKGVIFNYHPIA